MGINGTKPYVVWQEWDETPKYDDVPLTVFFNGEQKPTKKEPPRYEPKGLNSFYNKLAESYWLVYKGEGGLDPDLILELFVIGWPRTSFISFGKYRVGDLAYDNRYNKFRDNLKESSPGEPLDAVVRDLLKYIAPARVDV